MHRWQSPVWARAAAVRRRLRGLERKRIRGRSDHALAASRKGRNQLHITIVELEAAINRARAASPISDNALAPDLGRMAQVYGAMIYARQCQVTLESLPSANASAIRRWMGPPT